MLKNRSLRELISSRSSLATTSLWLICLALCAVAPTAFSQGFGFNDAFANATLISGPSGTTSGFSFGATRETNEPVHAEQGGASVWFAWIAPDSGTAVFDTFGSSFDTLLAAYTGTDLTNLVQVAANDDAEGQGFQSRINFSAESGKTYFIAVDGFHGASGSYTLNWQLPIITTNNPPANPGEIQLSASSYAVNENVPGPGSITISILYGGGSSSDVSVDFETVDGTAIAGTDYVATRGTRTFVAGDTTPQTFDVQINDDAIANGNRTFTIGLKNANGASLNAFSTATVTIVDDETVPVVSTSGQFNFTAALYRVTENESFPAPFPNNPTFNLWDQPGAIITVNRIAGTTGKVLVDYTTVDDFTAACGSTNGPPGLPVPDCDYFPTSGTLVFNDGQTSTNFVVPVLSDGVLNGDKLLELVLSNPRPAPEENPNLIVPTLGPQSTATLRIAEVNERWAFSIERATYAVQEFQTGIAIDVILPFGATNGATVQLSTREAAGSPAEYRFPLLAGSDYTDPFDNLFFPNPTYTDGSPDIINNRDYTPTTVTLTFPAGNPPPPPSFRQHVFIPITNDNVVEFNEDIRVYLHDPSPQGPGILNAFANATILFDDQPAGAADREWNPELISSTTPPFNPIPGANGTVEAVVVQPDQKSLIGGDFTAFNSTPRNRVARINRDGSVDLSFNPGTGANDFVSDVAIYDNGLKTNNLGKIVVVGGFSSFDNIQRNGIARLNSDGSLDTTFSPGIGANGPIRSVAILSIGKIVIGGEFTEFNGIPRNGVARLNDDGSLDLAFDPGSGANGTVWAVGLDGKSTAIQVGAGQFGFGPAEFRTNIDTRANSGTITVNFFPACVPDTLHVYYGPTLIFDSGPTNEYGGDINCDFNNFIPGGLTYVIPYGPGPYTDVTIVINEGSGDPGTVWEFNATIENSVVGERVVIGGDFTSIDGFPRNGVARLAANGPVDQSFDPGGGTDASVYAVKVQPDSKVLIGGGFTDFDFHARSRIARLNEDGSIDLSFDPGDGFNNSVYSIQLQGDGKPIVGGVFTRFDSVRRMGVARLFANGVLDTSFMDQAYNQFAGVVHPFSFEPDSFVNSVALDSSGGVMIAGSFTNVGGNGFFPNRPSFNNWTRQDIATKFNVARLIGGYTPGPGNMQFSLPTYTVDENSPYMAVTLQRVDGRLGTVMDDASTADRLAQAGLDYAFSKDAVTWPEWAYVLGARSVGYVGSNYFVIPLLDDGLIEGDELLDMLLKNPGGSITLGGEIIPLGGARGRSAAPLTIVDNDAQHGVIAFSSATYSVSETSPTATINIIRTNGSVGTVQVTVYTRNGSAQAGLDYTGRTNTLTFGPTVTNLNFTVPIINDTAVEFDETVLIVLTNATGFATLPGGKPTSTETAVLTITDNDFSAGRLNFSATNFFANEGDPVAQVTVTRTGGNVGAISVSAAATSGGATAGLDFTPVTNVLSWAAGDTTPRTLTIPLLEDAIVDPNETINLRLFNPSVAGSLGNRDTATLTIVDNDFYGQLEFSQANYEAEENGTNITITVVRRGGIAGTVSVDFAVADGTATLDSDYTTNLISSTRLTFGPGEISKSFSIGLINDTEQEGPETVLLSLFNAVNAGLGVNQNAVLTIIDDESSNVPAGSVDTAFDPLVGPDEPVYTLALGPDGKVLIGGDFNNVNHVTRHRMARLLSNGSLDRTYDAGQGPNRSVRALALQPDGKAIVGGFFTSINGTNRNHIARLLKDGTLDGFFNPGGGADNPVYAISLLPDGRVAIGGSFNTVNGVARQGVALLNTNGTLNLSFNPGLGANGVVYALALQGDGKLLIGGDFTMVNNISRPRIARLNIDGSVDMTFNPGSGVDAPVRAILVQPDGNVLIGGSFSNVGDTPRNFLARLNSDGSLDPLFLGSVSGGDNAVYALALQPDGKIIVAGDFSAFNGVHRSRITRLNSDGNSDPTINFGGGANAFIAALAVQPDKKIIAGGGFTTFDGVPRNHITRIHGGSLAGAGSIEFSASDFVVNEGDGSATVTLRRQGGTLGTVSVDFSVSDGTATSGADYADTNSVHTVVFGDGETYASFHLQVINDTIIEGPETVNLALVNPTGGAVIGEQPDATLTIVSDDSVISFLTSTYSVSENVLSGSAIISVIRTGATNTSVSVDYKSENGTAVAPADYGAVSDTLTFAPGEVLKSFLVPIRNDTNIEGNESVFLRLTNATVGNILGTRAAILTIVDDDFAPGIINFSSAAYTVNEYETNAVITIIRTNGSSGLVHVSYGTRNGSAQAGLDYTAVSGDISFADGETVKTFSVPITPDYIDEPDETVILVLSVPSTGSGGVSLGPISTATLTIVNNALINGSISFSQTNYVVNESNAVASLTVTRTLGFLGSVSVTYQTVDGTALTGSDFVGSTNLVSWADGEQGAKTISIPIINDSIVEQPENFQVVLSSPTGGATLGGRVNATVTVIDDDKAAGNLGFSQANYSVLENETNAVISVIRTFGDTGTVSIAYATIPGGTSSANVDYTNVTGTLTFLPGETNKTFTVPIVDNFIVDVNKTINLQLSNPTGGASTNGQLVAAVLTTVENDQQAGSIDASFNNSGANKQVYALLLQTNNNKIYAAGDFTQFSGAARVRLARLNPNGSLDNSFDAGGVLNDSVRALALQPDNKLLVGGLFTSISSTGLAYLVRFQTDGTLDTNFFGGLSGVDNAVYSIAVQQDGKLVIGGLFNNVDGATRNFIARITARGDLDSVFRPETRTDGAVRTIVVQNDGHILIGGDFSFVNGVARPGIARLNQDGALDTTFDPQTGPNGPVYSLALQPDGRILVGGSFTLYAGANVGRLVRLLPNGQRDTSFNPSGVGADEFVSAVALQPDGKIVVAGGFTAYNGITRNRLVRLTSNGALDPNINFGDGANSLVSAVALQPDKKIIIGGAFTSFDGLPRNYIARLNGGDNLGFGSIVFSATNYNAIEGSTVTITVKRLIGTSNAVSVAYSTADGTAIASKGHYIPVSGVLNFAQGETTKTFDITVTDNAVTNVDRTINLILSNAVGGASLGSPSTATVTIINNDGVFAFSIATYSVSENAGTAAITVDRVGSAAGNATVQFASSDGTASAGNDYISVAGTLTFTNGQTQQSFLVPIIDDTTSEGNETVNLTLSSPSANYTLGRSAATLILVDNDLGQGGFTFANNTYTAGEQAGTALITVLRAGGNSGSASVEYFTSDGTATAPLDYLSTRGTLVFADGESSKTFAVPIVDDTLVEGPETVNLTLTNATGALLGPSTATLTILSDETILSFPAQFVVTEGTPYIQIPVSRSTNGSGPVSVQVITIDGTAIAGQDYVSVSTNLNWAAGDTSSQLVTVPIIDDNIGEADEVFTVQLIGANGEAQIDPNASSATVIIKDDDSSFSFDNAAYTVSEAAGTASVNVLRLGLTNTSGSVEFVTVDGTATAANGDYVPLDTTLTFAPGESFKTVNVQIIDDSLNNGDRDFGVLLRNATGANLANPSSAAVTIVDDEQQRISAAAGQFSFSTNAYRVTEFEGDLLSTNLGFLLIKRNTSGCLSESNRLDISANHRDVLGAMVTVNRLGGSQGKVMVDYDTVDLYDPFCGLFFLSTNFFFNTNAYAGCDYAPTHGTLIFDNLQTSTNFVIPIFTTFFGIVTNAFLFDKSITVVLSNPRPVTTNSDPNLNENPALIAPTLGPNSVSRVDIVPLDVGFGTANRGGFSFARATHRLDERDTGQPCPVNRPAGEMWVPIYLPGGGPGNVRFRARQNFSMRPGPGALFEEALDAGSDNAISAPTVFPNPIVTDGSPVITNQQDFVFVDTTITFGQGVTLTWARVPILDDPEVEFNEDIFFELIPLPGNPPVNADMDVARGTILFDDQPAGAADREWNPEGVTNSIPPFNHTPGANNVVHTTAVQDDQKTIIGGEFTAYNAFRAPKIGRINTDGTYDTSFSPGVGANEAIDNIAIYRNGVGSSANLGKIIVVGGFTSFDGTLRNGIARLNSDGSLDFSFRPGDGADGAVSSVAIQQDGKLVVVGEFTTFNGIARSRVARLNEDGSLDLTFNPGSGANAQVLGVGLASNGTNGQKIVIGGEFTSFSGVARSGVAQLNPDGSLDLTFDPGGGTDGPVYSLAVQSDNKVVIGGFFTDVDFRSRNSIARLNPDGTLDLTFDPGDGASSAVYSVVIGPDGKAMIGGVFTSYNGTRRLGLARLLPGGSLDTSFLDTAYNQFAGLVNGFSFQPANFVRGIAFETNGAVMIGGSFTNLGGNFSEEINRVPGYTNVWTRQNKVTRYNVARLVGGYTPGPGNIEVASPSYRVNENGGDLSLTLLRRDGRLGSIGETYVTGDRIAQAGVDYSYTQSNAFWKQQGYFDLFGIPQVPVSIGYAGQSFFHVPIYDDSLIEGDESLTVNGLIPTGTLYLGGEIIPLGAARGTSRAIVTIADNDFQHGTFTFSSPVFVVGENNPSATITVLRTNGSNGSVSVDFYTRDGFPPDGATNGLDYTAVTRTLVFGPGITNQSFTIPILNDVNVERLDEYVQLILTNATGGATLPGGTPTSFASAMLDIIDDDFPSGYVSFASTNFLATEGAPAQVILTRRGGNSGSLSVQVLVSSGTATDGLDFTGGVTTVTWTNGDTSAKTFTIPIVDDAIPEPDETINLRLQNPSIAGAIGVTNTARVTIQDNDFNGTFQFSKANYDVEENGGTVTITVLRNVGRAGTVSVDVVISNISATVGLDYNTNTVPRTLNFGPNEIVKTFTIGITDDPLAEGLETIGLGLRNPTGGAVLGYPSNALVSIIDDEDTNIPAGSPDTTFVTGTGPDSAVYNLGLQRDGKIVIGGQFTTVEHSARLHLARLLANGGLDPNYLAGSGVNREIRALAIQDDGKALIGGLFTQVQGTNFNHIARMNTDGTVDAFFDPGAGADNSVYAIALLPNGRIVAGGSFTTFNGASRPGIVVLNTNGTVNSIFRPGVGFDKNVFALAVQSDGKILVGGDFNTVNNLSSPRLARLNPDGSVDASFNIGAGPDGTVRVIAVQPDGAILIGGSFRSINGTNRSRLARLNPDGSLDGTFLQNLAGADDSVYALALQFDGKILVGGDFRSFNGVSRGRITRLNPDGQTDPTINFGTGANSAVTAIAIQDDRRIVLGGAFTTFDDQPHNYVVRLYGGALAGAGAFQFTSATYNANEFDGQAIITVRRKGGTRGTATVSYFTADGTAISGLDYLTASGPLSFPPGEVVQQFSVPVVQDEEVEDVETVRLTLTGPGGGAKLGLQPIATLNIISDDSHIGFAAAAFSVSEGTQSGHATITVVRTDATNSSVSVGLVVGGGTATAGVDYLPPGVTSLDFAAGELVKTFQIPITNDTNVEGNETVLMYLTNATSSGTVYYSLGSSVLTIVDDDFAFGTIAFNQAQYITGESQTNVAITVARSGGSDGIVSVDYMTRDGTATNGLDYVAVSGTITFADGETVKSFVVPVVFDRVDEANETVQLSIFNVRGGATLGLTNAILIITNVPAADGIRIVPVGAALVAESGPVNGTLDAAETATFSLGLRNAGALDANNLVATLLSTNGISAITTSRTYGPLLAGSHAVSQPYQFLVTATNGSRITLVLKLQDGALNLGTATYEMFVGSTSFTFSNTAAITINDQNAATKGRATPYPSVIPVSGLNGTVSAVSMSVYGMTHTYPGDIDILLVGPHGESVVVMSDAGSSSSAKNEITDVNLTFKDDLGVFLPETTQIVSGTYQPTNYGAADSWPTNSSPAAASPPANAPSRTRLLTAGGNQDPNGQWELFVVDDTLDDSGVIAGGWSVTINMIGSGTAATDLEISTIASPNPTSYGQELNYTLSVTNWGPGKATGIQVTNFFDSTNTVFLRAQGTYTTNRNSVAFAIPALNSGAGTNLFMTVRANPTAFANTNTIFNTAVVTGNETDLYTGNNFVTGKAIVFPVPRVQITQKGTQAILSWSAVGGGLYTVEATDKLVPANWVPITVTPAFSGGMMNVTISNPTNQCRFYRIRPQ